MLIRTIAFTFATVLCAGLVSPGNAAGTLYVAAGGTGSSPCTAAAPCNTIATALAFAIAGDTIVCLSPPDRAALSITKSVTVDCSGTRMITPRLRPEGHRAEI
jgi:hypothetical protein